MADESPKPNWPWRDFLKGREADELAEIDALRETANQTAKRRTLIVNRAIHRAKYAARKQENQTNG